MSERLTFFAWQRSGIYTAIQNSDLTEGEGRLSGAVTLTLENTEAPADSAPEVIPFAIMGPGDVHGLKPGAVRQMVPAPGTVDAETTKCVYVDFAAIDFPWATPPNWRMTKSYGLGLSSSSVP